MSKRVLLINPPWTLTKSCSFYFTSAIPLGLAYIAAYLEREGHGVEILDALALGTHPVCKGNWLEIGMSDEQIKDHIQKFQPHIVGITNPFTSQVHNMHRVAFLVKSVDKKIPVVVGGVHPSVRPEECLSDNNIDFLVQGEGEEAVSELVNSIDDVSRERGIKSLYYRKNGGIECNTSRKPIMDLDSLPFPAYHLLPMERYFEISSLETTHRGGHHKRWVPIITSRGCPYNCCFCAAHYAAGKRWRARSAENVADELEYLIAKYNIRIFTFEDDNFTFDKKRAGEVCEQIMERGLAIEWSTPNGIRADCIDEELAQKMQQAGCKAITIGIEHGDQEFLNNVIKKQLDLKKVESAVRIIRKSGIAAGGFFIIGIPPEDKTSFRETLNFARKLARLGFVSNFNLAMPLPGTEVMETCLKRGYLKQELKSRDYILTNHTKPLIKTPFASPEDLIRWRRKAILITNLTFFFFHPIRFFKHPFIKQTLADLKDITSIGRRFSRIKSLLLYGS